MFKIDKSSVEYIDSNKDIVVIKQWLEENVGEIGTEQTIGEISAQGDVEDKQEQKEEEAKRTWAAVESADSKAILQCAKEQAQQLIDEATQQSQQIKDQAKREAMENETKRIQDLCEKIQTENAQQLNLALSKLEDIHMQSQSMLQKMILQLSLDIAQKVINTELEKNDTVFETLIRQAMHSIKIKSECTLRLNAREYKRHFADGGMWLADELEAPFDAVMDNTVPPGGCVVETPDCVIRVGVDAQLKMIAMALNQ